jgi:hypothetical protein
MTEPEVDAMFQRIARAIVDAAREGDEGAQRAILLLIAPPRVDEDNESE